MNLGSIYNKIWRYRTANLAVILINQTFFAQLQLLFLTETLKLRGYIPKTPVMLQVQDKFISLAANKAVIDAVKETT